MRRGQDLHWVEADFACDNRDVRQAQSVGCKHIQNTEIREEPGLGEGWQLAVKGRRFKAEDGRRFMIEEGQPALACLICS